MKSEMTPTLHPIVALHERIGSEMDEFLPRIMSNKRVKEYMERMSHSIQQLINQGQKTSARSLISRLSRYQWYTEKPNVEDLDNQFFDLLRRDYRDCLLRWISRTALNTVWEQVVSSESGKDELVSHTIDYLKLKEGRNAISYLWAEEFACKYEPIWTPQNFDGYITDAIGYLYQERIVR